MKERPTLFNTEMVNAVLSGRKTRIYPIDGLDQNSPDHLIKRLANGCAINTENGCWEWQKHRNNHGYGKLTINKRGVYAHRLSYQLTKGELPKGMEIMHSCDNPSCINPDHLLAGTHSQNMKDCSERLRAKIPLTSLAGEKNGAAKLSQSDVFSINRLLDDGWKQTAIAERFGISQSQVSQIKRGKSWVVEFKRVEQPHDQ